MKIFSSNAENTFGTKSKKQKLHKRHKPWFNQECKVARNSYHSVRKNIIDIKLHIIKNLLKTVSKQYKSTISKNVKKYKDDKVNRLKNLQTANPREYWKIINSLDKKNETTPPLNDLYTYFKTLNSNSSDIRESSTASDENVTNSQNNEEINQSITSEEIFSAVKSLKNNKSPGRDNILNEHIKCTIHAMLPTYTKFFNLVLIRALYPKVGYLAIFYQFTKIKAMKHCQKITDQSLY